MEYYKVELVKFNESIEEVRKSRVTQSEELFAQMPDMISEPFADFNSSHEDSVEKLSKALGLGRKYGAPRRQAQEQIRSVTAQLSQSVSNVESLFTYADQVSRVNSSEDLRRVKPVTGCPRHHPDLRRRRDIVLESIGALSLAAEAVLKILLYLNIDSKR